MLTTILEPLSIIIITKNEEGYIGKSLDKLTNAIEVWGGKAEIILVDNGSEDSTRAIALKYGCKVIEDPYSSLGKLRNVGARSSSGLILGFLDADCLVDPKWISYCLSNFSNDKVSMVGTRAIPDLKNATWVERAWFNLFTGVDKPRYINWLGSSNFFIKREDFFAIGGFNEYLKVAEDVDLCNRLRKKENIILEKRVDTIHLRESKTLYEIFKREFWRGKGSIKSFACTFKATEFLSVFVPLLNFIILLSFLISGLCQKKIGFLFLLAFLFLPVLLMFKKKARVSSFKTMGHCYIIAAVYLFARTCSLLYEATLIFRNKVSKKTDSVICKLFL